MTRSKKFLINTIASAAYQGVIMLIGIITPRLMLMAYGSEINGLVTSVTQFVSYFNLVQAGLSGAAIYSLYKPLANDDHDEISSILTATKEFYYKSGIAFTILLVSLAAIYPIFVKTHNLSSFYMAILIFAIGFNSIIDFFLLAKYSALLNADQRSYVISFGSIVTVILNFIIVVIMTNARANIVLLKVVAISTVIVRSIILYVYCHKKYSYVNYKSKPNYKALEKRWSAFFLQVLQIIQQGSPAVLLTFLSQLKNVSIYSVFNMVIYGISGMLDIFTSGLSASFGDVISRGEQKVLHKAYRDFEFTYYGLVTVVYSIALVMIMPFVRIYTRGISDANYDQIALGVLFIINAYLYSIKIPQGMMVVSAGLYKETQRQSAIQAALIVIFGIILIPLLGIKGMLIAMIISNLYRVIDLIIYIPRTVTKLPIKETVINLFWSVITFSIIVLLMSFIINKHMRNMFQWVLYSILVIVVAVSVWCVVSIITNRSQFMSMLERMKSMIKRKNK